LTETKFAWINWIWKKLFEEGFLGFAKEWLRSMSSNERISFKRWSVFGAGGDGVRLDRSETEPASLGDLKRHRFRFFREQKPSCSEFPGPGCNLILPQTVKSSPPGPQL
jgi:hypothetical protein